MGAVAVAAAAAALLGWSLWGGEAESGPSAVSAAPPPEPGSVPTRTADLSGAAAAQPEPPDARPEELDPSEGMFDASALAWSQVDLDEVRAALPQNGYWERSMPTSDPEVLRAREEERAYWEHQYGKVLSNTGTEEEVREYYDHRQRVAEDAVEFSGYLLDHYGGVLPERDLRLLLLAQRLNRARLEELPRNLSDALDRREAHARAREEWLAQKRLFEGEGAPEPEPD